LITKTKKNTTTFSIQKHIGIILMVLTLSTAILNFLNGLNNFNDSTVQAFTNITVLPILIGSFLFFITVQRESIILQYSQVFIIILAGFVSIILNTPGNLTGTLFVLFALTLAYQYGYFVKLFYIKFFSILGIYIVATFISVFFVRKSFLPFGIPSILFSITTVYLFWTVFQQEIRQYLIQTNQLSNKLGKVNSENVKLIIKNVTQEELIEKKNKVLEESLKEKTIIEEKLLATLKKKDGLLQEVHHRVKNNLAVITGLFSLQRTDNENDPINSLIEQNETRLQAMAAVHEAIYQNENYEFVTLADYCSDITQNLIMLYSTKNDLKINIDIENIEVKIDIAVPIGIILNDCISNSIIYGFDSGVTQKEISIKMKQNTDLELIISDNGKEFSLDTDLVNKSASFSIYLIKLLAEEQLGGTFIQNYNGGNFWIFRFPLYKF